MIFAGKKRYQRRSQVSKYNPDNTRILWDFHGVVASYNNRRIAHEIFKNKRSLLKVFHPFILYQELLGCYALMHGQEYSGWNAITQKHPDFAKALIAIGNCVEPIEDTVRIIAKLHKLGYKQDLVSDINTDFLHDLQRDDRFRPIFRNFENLISVDYSNPSFKCSQNYFENYKKEHNKHNDKLILIDDWLENIYSAQQHDIKGILYENQVQLNEQLEKMQIFKGK